MSPNRRTRGLSHRLSAGGGVVTGSADEVLRIVGSLDTDIVPASDGGGSCIGCCY